VIEARVLHFFICVPGDVLYVKDLFAPRVTFMTGVEWECFSAQGYKRRLFRLLNSYSMENFVQNNIEIIYSTYTSCMKYDFYDLYDFLQADTNNIFKNPASKHML